MACFPSFAGGLTGTSSVLEFEAISGSGTATALETWQLEQEFGTERWKPMQAKASRSPASLAALARWVASESPAAGRAVRIAVYRTTWSKDPDRRRAGPLRRELLAEVPL
jgi:hypothetical protein